MFSWRTKIIYNNIINATSIIIYIYIYFRLMSQVITIDNVIIVVVGVFVVVVMFDVVIIGVCWKDVLNMDSI